LLSLGHANSALEQEEDVSIEDTKRRLVWHGMFLFLLGLLTGFAEPQFKNLRMGLAAHLEGVIVCRQNLLVVVRWFST
jgi:hypothetical protein